MVNLASAEEMLQSTQRQSLKRGGHSQDHGRCRKSVGRDSTTAKASVVEPGRKHWNLITSPFDVHLTAICGEVSNLMEDLD